MRGGAVHNERQLAGAHFYLIEIGLNALNHEARRRGGAEFLETLAFPVELERVDESVWRILGSAGRKDRQVAVERRSRIGGRRAVLSNK